MKNLHIAIILSLLCAGCIGLIIPIPEQASEFSNRAPIRKESLGFLEVGSTKIEEVLLTLGPPDYTQENERVFVYQWETESGWLFAGISMGGGGPRKTTDDKSHQLLIEFDDIAIVKRFEIKENKRGSRVKEYF